MKLFSILITPKPETNPTAPAVLLRDFSTILGVSWWGGDPKTAWVMFLQDWSLWEKFCDVDLLNAVLMLHHPAPWISRMWLFGHWEDPSTHFVTHWGLCPTANMDGNGMGMGVGAHGGVTHEPCSPTDSVWPWDISFLWICVYWPFTPSLGIVFYLPALPGMSCLWVSVYMQSLAQLSPDFH